jgi:hypothetical protein
MLDLILRPNSKIEIQTKVLRVFLLAIHNQPLQLYLEISVKEKGGKPYRNPLPYGLRNPYRNLKSEKPQRNCTLMNKL